MVGGASGTGGAAGALLAVGGPTGAVPAEPPPDTPPLLPPMLVPLDAAGGGAEVGWLLACGAGAGDDAGAAEASGGEA